MNGYTQLLRHIKQTGQPLVSTITQGDIAALDTNDTTLFPLLHVSVGNATFPADGVVRFSVKIGCFDIRDSTGEPNPDAYYDNDNEIDNLNATLAILNRIWLLLKRDTDETNISVSGIPGLEQCTEFSQNLLDGWIMAFEVDTPNILINLCE
ncbi:hypothetical protein OGH69_16640 [Flavobacterium sp. MFBS3-15]|uniref:hypothetical protein n=1 Tax=Flavobacterium sp. MFBS3-15 TaxID=2989816 RepID=UPI002236BF03|nr:hypothetical protein [Flavobacterium sp. MFBS3-15]MCW4470601.1 hypothetical protein [Flavobacterium sp. MFBS3-15]